MRVELGERHMESGEIHARAGVGAHAVVAEDGDAGEAIALEPPRVVPAPQEAALGEGGDGGNHRKPPADGFRHRTVVSTG